MDDQDRASLGFDANSDFIINKFCAKNSLEDTTRIPKSDHPSAETKELDRRLKESTV
jgi:hypothetical protein